MNRLRALLTPPAIGGVLLYLVLAPALLTWLGLDDLTLMVHAWSDR